jgi:Protein of unknown function (DUF2490)
MMFRKSIILCGLICLFQVSWGQNENDAGLWTGLSVGLDLGKGLTGEIAPQIRLDENMSRISGAFSDFGIEKKLHDNLDLSLEYRGGLRRNDDFYEGQHRFSSGLTAKLDVKKFRLAYTVRYQLSPSLNGGDRDVDIKNVLRQKVGVKYGGIKKYELATSFEVFVDGEESGFSDWRWQGSVERKFSKRKFLSLGYLVQKNLYDLNMDFVVLMTYKYELKSLKKSKEEEPAPKPQ